MVKIAPSLLAADFANLAGEVKAIEAAGADWLHLDVMDGHFVPNISFGPAVIKALKPHCQLFFDVHLMIDPVDPYIEDFAKAGADLISVHVEAGIHLERTISLIHQKGIKAGVVLNPATPLSSLDWVLDKIDLVLLMSVNPGFGGQKFIPATLEKLRALAAMRAGRNFVIEVDGGVTADNASDLIKAGADVLVAGSAVFGKDNYQAAINALRA